METADLLGIIAGSGVYPRLLIEGARRAGVKKIVVVAVDGETDRSIEKSVDEIHWQRVGQLARLLKSLREAGVNQAIMAGQIAPKNLFDLRPDWKALLVLAKLKQRNAESIFSAIAHQLSEIGVELLPATTFLQESLAPRGVIAGRNLSRQEQRDVEYGWTIAKDIARLDIGQTVIVKAGTVLAVEGFDGTNATITRGGALAKAGAVMIKVAKPNQDMRFDVPVVGVETIQVARAANVRVIAVEAERTLLLEKDAILESVVSASMTLVGH